MSEDSWHVYIVECRTGELYVGISQNVGERIKEHNKGQACRYTKFRRPVNLLYAEACGDYLSARKKEREIKKFSRRKKLSLISKLSDLSSPCKAGDSRSKILF